MLRHFACVTSLAFSVITVGLADEPTPSAERRPQWQRLLQGDDVAKAAELQKRIDAAEQTDRYDEAIRLHEELLALRIAAQGGDHWEAINERWELDAARKVAALSADERDGWRKALRAAVDARQLRAKRAYRQAQAMREEYSRWCRKVLGEKHPYTATSYYNLGSTLDDQGRHAEAEPLYRRALELRLALLGENHPRTADTYNNLASNLDDQGKHSEAQPHYQKSLELRIELLGEKHPDTAFCYNNLAYNLNCRGKHAQAEALYQKVLDLRLELLGAEHPDTAQSYSNLGSTLDVQGEHAKAELLLERALELHIELLGEKHPDTAQCYNNLAYNLNAQGKHAEAERAYRRALDLWLDMLGEKHRSTANGYNNLARNLDAQGKYAEAFPFFQKALQCRRELFGENHPDTATSCDNLAHNLDAQGKHAEAEPLHQKALRLRVGLLGEEHPDTAISYNNLAYNLNRQGKYSEAQTLYQRALDLRLDLLGEKHPNTANSYNNLATNLDDQGKHSQAQPLHQKALGLRLDLHGEKHPDTAQSYSNVAYNLNAQGRDAEAEPLYRKALELRLLLLGEKHADTARSYNNLAGFLDDLGMYTDAQPLYQKALDVDRELLGEKHPDTAAWYNNFGHNLAAQGKYADAQPLLMQAVKGYEAARLSVTGRGLDRAVFGVEHSPYRLLAATEAHLAAPAEAWVAVESDLARGLLDETASRIGDSLVLSERNRQTSLTERLHQLQPLILALVSKQSSTADEKCELAKLHTERRNLEGELGELSAAISRRELATLVQVQAALRADAALVLWVDVDDRWGRLQEHWGCVLRSSGVPLWQRLSGTGPGCNWASDDEDLPHSLNLATARNASADEIAGLANKVYAQRIAPLEKHLDGVERLFVVPVNAMAGIPLELVTNKYTISYIPSGTLLARQKERSRASGAALLALGDPVLAPLETPADEPLPPGGLLITHVLPDSNAAKAGIEPGDVMLEFAAATLSSEEQLGKLIAEHGADETIAIAAWRDGKVSGRIVAAGNLDVTFDPRPARDAIIARRETDKVLLAVTRGGDWAELPGSAVEVNRITALASDGQATVLTRSQASEQELERLRTSGELERFRYLHFATHGEPNNARSFESALILSQDQISGDIPPSGEKYYDGRLTANEVLENWNLNADLVTLSACESALGRPGGGDGLLGFAQAFLLAGARSVCLSLWKVDDTATALLMDRFYQNLLGKRAGLAQPMPKTAALAEAKRWLRELSLDDATKLAATMASGVRRGKNEPALNLVVPTTKPVPEDHEETRPFSHPRYWAAFILIGDPD